VLVPALPWHIKQPISPNAQYVAMASRLPLKRHRSVPGFLLHTLRIRRQLAKCPGLVGYMLDARLGNKTFWTFSVWEDRPSLGAFARSEPHRRITKQLQRSIEGTRFKYVTVVGSELPLTWPKVKSLLAEPGPGTSQIG
jgi:heme-degrading monooxygenase HmoA